VESHSPAVRAFRRRGPRLAANSFQSAYDPEPGLTRNKVFSYDTDDENACYLAT
jgi:hypothetical protein